MASGQPECADILGVAQAASAVAPETEFPSQPDIQLPLEQDQRVDQVGAQHLDAIRLLSLHAKAMRENCSGNNSADVPVLCAVTCTAPRSNTTCGRSTGTNICAVGESTKASDSNSAGSALIRSNNSAGLMAPDSFKGEKPATLGSDSS